MAGLTALGLGREQLCDLVAEQLDGRRVHLLTVDVQTHPYDRPALTTAGRHVVRGTASDESGEVHEYAFFVKVVQAWSRSPLFEEVPEPLRSRLAPLMPWRTEPDIYRGDLRHHLPAGLSLPPAFRVIDLDDRSAAIWLGSVPVCREPWDVSQHRRAAYLLGRLTASRSVAPFAADVPSGRTPRRYAENWLAVTVIPAMSEDAFWRRPLIAETFDPAVRRRILQAAAELPELVDELESLPATTAHGDACTDNLLRTPGAGLVMIDFGFWGTAPIGFDLGQLILGEIQLGRRPAHTFPALEQACLPAYVQGLRDEGCEIPAAQVRRAHALSMAVFHAIPAVPYEHMSAGAAPELLPLFANRAEMARHALDLLDAGARRPRK